MLRDKLNQQARGDGEKFIMLYDFITWYFSFEGKDRESDALKYSSVLAFLIDLEAADFANFDEDDYFQCTSEFIERRLFISDGSFRTALDKLKYRSILDWKTQIISTGTSKFVKLNYDKILEMQSMFQIYENRKSSFLEKYPRGKFDVKAVSQEVINKCREEKTTFLASPDTPFQAASIPLSGQPGYPSLASPDTPFQAAMGNNNDNNNDSKNDSKNEVKNDIKESNDSLCNQSSSTNLSFKGIKKIYY